MKITKQELIEAQAITVHQTTHFDVVRQPDDSYRVLKQNKCVGHPRGRGERAKLTAIRIAEHLQELTEATA